MFMEFPRKSDFHIMACHHVLTMILVGFSAVIGHTRIGVLVMFLHDLSDTLLHGSKILHYSLEGSHWHIMCDVSFATFALVFFVTRLMLYPYLIFEAASLLEQAGPSFMKRALIAALSMLVFFHMYWFFLIMKILKEAIMGGEVQGDVRGDDEVDLERKEELGIIAPRKHKQTDKKND